MLPVRGGRVDRAAAAVAMSVAPAVGALLGAILAALLWLLLAAGAPALVAAAVTVAASALLTRGMHLDGLADTTDALGSYRRGDQALEIMKKPDIGPFGVAAIALTLLIQATALTAIGAGTPAGWEAPGELAAMLGAVVTAYASGRLAITLACRRGMPAARPEGLGALVAGTVPIPAVVLITLLIAAASAFAVPGRPWQGPAAVAAAVLVTLALLGHTRRRFGGVTGDVLGAATEVATTTTLVALTLGTA